MNNQTLSFDNKLVYKFILHLYNDPLFDINELCTKPYLLSVGDEIGWDMETTSEVIDVMLEMGLLKIS